MRVRRKIVAIDAARCDGCGRCVPACPDGALRMEGGKVLLVGERFCDGCGRCLAVCPLDALAVEEREAEKFEDIVMGRC